METLMRCLLLIGIAFFIVGCAKKPSGEIVKFSDKNLETAIRNALRVPKRTIYESDLGKLEELLATEKNITNLSGIEYCKNLKSLFLHINQLSDISL